MMDMLAELNESLRPAGYEASEHLGFICIDDSRTGKRVTRARDHEEVLRFLIGHCCFGRLDRKQGLLGEPPGATR